MDKKEIKKIIKEEVIKHIDKYMENEVSLIIEKVGGGFLLKSDGEDGRLNSQTYKIDFENYMSRDPNDRKKECGDYIDMLYEVLYCLGYMYEKRSKYNLEIKVVENEEYEDYNG